MSKILEKTTRVAALALALAFGLGLASTGWARVKPIAVWNGDFVDGSERGGFTLDKNGNTVSGGIITIDGSTGGAKFDTPTSYNTKHFSAVIGLENVSTPSESQGYGAIVAAYQTESNANRSPDMAGCAIDSSGKIKGIWNSNDWGTAAGAYPTGNSRNYVVYYAKHLSSGGTPDSSGGGSWVYVNKNTTAEYGADGLRGSSINYLGYTVGGKRSDGTHQLSNARVVYIALFPGTSDADGATDSDLRAWSLPAMTSADTISSSGGDITSGDRSAYGVNLNGGTVNVTADTTIAALFVQADTTLAFASDAELTINGPIYVAENVTLTLAPVMAEGSKNVITAGTVGANDNQITVAAAEGYTTSVSISGGTIAVSKTGAVQTFSYTCGGSPSGWVTSWGGETFGKYYRVGPNSSQPLVNEVRSGYHPWANLAAKTSAFSFAMYADATHMESNYGIMASFGQASNMLVLYRQGDYIKVGRYISSGFDKDWAAGVALPSIGYHLYTVTYDPDTGVVYLYLDGGATYSTNDGTSNTFTTGDLAVGFQIGSVYSGKPNIFSLGTGMAFSAAVGYDEVLTAGAVSALAANYPATDGSVTWTTSRDTHSDDVLTIYDMTQTGAYLGMSDGELTIPSGATVSTPHVRMLNTSTTADDVTVDIAGQLNVTSTSTAKNVWSERDSLKGILFGHYKGTGTYNITGSLIGENAYLETIYTAGSQALNINNGGLIKVKGLYAASNGSTVTLNAGGTLEVSEIPSDGSPITKNFGAGTFKVTSSQTETRAINFNASEGAYTTLDPVANTLTLNAAAVTGTGDIDVAPSGAGKVVFASLGSSYSGNIKVSSGSAEIQGASGYTGSIEANAPLTINNAEAAELGTLSGTGAITKAGAGTLTITGAGTNSGTVTINNGGKIVLSGNEAKIGTGSFRLTSNGAGVDIIPGAGNTITLAPDFIVSSTSGNDSPYINVGPGKFVAASTGTSTYDYGHFGGATISIVDGGELELNANKQLLGANMSGTINVASGGKLTFATYQKNAWTINLNGGAIDVTGTSTPIEVWGQRTLNVTDDSSINSVPSGSYTNPNIWINRGGGNSAVNWTINVSQDKTLSFNACIANGSAAASQGNNVIKSGAGTLALNGANGSGYTYSGTTTVSAGTLLVNAPQSGSAYDLAAGTTLKFGTSANLFVPSLALPASGTVTVDVSDLTLSSSGTTLITFTSAPSAADVASKMTPSNGTFLKLEGSTLKAYPLVATYGGENYATFEAAINAALADEGGAANLANITVVDGTAELPDWYVIQDDTVKVAVAAKVIPESSTTYYATLQEAVDNVNNDSYVEIHADSLVATSSSNSIYIKPGAYTFAITSTKAGYGEFVQGTQILTGVYSYAPEVHAATFVWNGGASGAWNDVANWTSTDGTVAVPPSDALYTIDFSSAATVSINSDKNVAQMNVGAIVSLNSASAENTYAITVASGGTIALTTVSASLAVTRISPSSAPVLGGELSPESYYVKSVTSGSTTTYSVDAYNTVAFTAPNATVTRTDALGNAIKDGDTITFTVAPDSGYNVTGVTVGGDTLVADNGTYSYTVTGDATITVATAEAANVTITPVSVTYGADFTNATITATVSGTGYDTATYSLTWGSAAPVAGVRDGSTVTFTVPVSSAPHASVSYTITATVNDSQAGSTAPQSAVVADSNKWVDENSGTTGTAAAGGSWSNAVTYAENVAAIEDNTFTALNCSTGDLVTVTIENVVYEELSDLDVSAIAADSQGAFCLGAVEANDVVTTNFMILAKENNAFVWKPATWSDTPALNTEYDVEFSFDYAHGKYSVKINGTALSVNNATAFDLCTSKTEVKAVDFKGSGKLSSILGVESTGYMVRDSAGHWYATIADAIAAYDAANGPYVVLHDAGTPPAGWKIVKAGDIWILKKDVSGVLILTY